MWFMYKDYLWKKYESVNASMLFADFNDYNCNYVYRIAYHEIIVLCFDSYIFLNKPWENLLLGQLVF